MGKSLGSQDGYVKNITKNDKTPNNKRATHRSKGEKPKNPYIRLTKGKKLEQ